MKLLQKQYIEYLLLEVKKKPSNNLIKFVYFLWFVIEFFLKLYITLIY